jgi:hypothetical protein
VHSFTSPISVLIPLIGESVGQGLFLIRLVSVLISGLAIYYAHRIVTALGLTLFAQVAVLSYVSLDYLQIFFGTAGMETQIATTVMLMVIWFFISQQYTWLGVALGLAMLCRPEFAALFPVVGLWMLIYAPREIPRVAAMSILVAAPWFLFATLYYGSPIPNTIVAKKNAFLRDRLYEGDGSLHVAMQNIILQTSIIMQHWALVVSPTKLVLAMLSSITFISVCIIGFI